MSLEKTKILFMGKPVQLEDLEDQPDVTQPVTLEHLFAPVTLTPKTIDYASRIVPDEHWKPHGLHTWLQQRADMAFSKLQGNDRDIKLGRLKYFFDFDHNGPVLTDLKLL